MFRVHSVSQRPNLRHLGEPLGEAESLLKAVSFKKATEGMGRRRVTNARWERVPHSGSCNTKTTGGKGFLIPKKVLICDKFRKCTSILTMTIKTRNV